MSVLIKGMEMPEHCTDCVFWYDGVFEHCLLNMEIQSEDVPEYAGQYPKDCPLIEVPPHGRLIDADALPLYDQLFMQGKNDSGVWVRYKKVEDLIRSAPTVLLAEGGST